MPAMASKPRGDIASVGQMKLPAALLTRPVKPPLSNSDSTISSTAEAMRMSTPKVSMRAFGNCLRQASAVASHTCLRRPQMATSAPRLKKCSAMAWPKPVPPPVTRMRWPLIKLDWYMQNPCFQSSYDCMGSTPCRAVMALHGPSIFGAISCPDPTKAFFRWCQPRSPNPANLTCPASCVVLIS